MNNGFLFRRILWVQDASDVTLENIPGLLKEDIMKADLIITDKGRILKDRYDSSPRTVGSFQLVETPKKKTKTRYRSIYED